MEQNLPVVAKKFWQMVRVALFMLRKGISKSKLIADFNMVMKRWKIAGKAIQNLMFHHTHNWAAAVSASAAIRRPQDGHESFTFSPHPDEYEFSCSNSPAYPTIHLPFNLKKNKRKGSHAPPAVEEIVAANAVMKALEMLQSETASPALPGFGRTPTVRQLRITDSPFPVRDVDGDNYVDEAAEQFIKRFYKDLRKQNSIAWGHVDGKS